MLICAFNAAPHRMARAGLGQGERMQAEQQVFLPLLLEDRSAPVPPPVPTGMHRINAPLLSGIAMPEAAIAWFGKVTPTENYADIRVAYSQEELWVHLEIFDQFLWYDASPSPAEMSDWDAVSLFVDISGNSAGAPDETAYRFDGMLNWWEPREAFTAAYQGNDSSWNLISVPFTTVSGWRGNAPNDALSDHGWVIEFFVPFSSLGLSGPPNQGENWGLGLELHDRDDASGSTPIPIQAWPPGLDSTQPDTWGQVRFGLPVYSPPTGLIPTETIVIRHNLNDAIVKDGMAGGSSTCADFMGDNRWTDWGELNYAGSEFLVVQNEADVSDWICFSKLYITFPLDSLPAGMEIISATLTLHLMGNAGEGELGQAADSLIQALTVSQEWDETTLTWNNAPLAIENVSRSWVEPISEWPGWPGPAWEWDLGYAADQAYRSGQPLRLVLYSADGDYQTGKYFSSSDAGDWDEVGRPTLTVVLGEP